MDSGGILQSEIPVNGLWGANHCIVTISFAWEMDMFTSLPRFSSSLESEDIAFFCDIFSRSSPVWLIVLAGSLRSIDAIANRNLLMSSGSLEKPFSEDVADDLSVSLSLLDSVDSWIAAVMVSRSLFTPWFSVFVVNC